MVDVLSGVTLRQEHEALVLKLQDVVVVLHHLVGEPEWWIKLWNGVSNASVLSVRFRIRYCSIVFAIRRALAGEISLSGSFVSVNARVECENST